MSTTQDHTLTFRQRFLQINLQSLIVLVTLAAIVIVAYPNLRGQFGLKRATALVRVRMEDHNILGSGHAVPFNSEKFRVYKDTQAELIKSDFVIQSALRKTGISNLPLIKAQKQPADWLADRLRVSTDDDSEIIEISLSGQDSAQIEDIVNAIVDSYFAEIVQAERDNDLDRFNVLKRSYRKSLEDVKDKHMLIHRIAQEVNEEDGFSAELELRRIELDLMLASMKRTKLELDELDLNLKKRPRINVIQPAIITQGR